MKSCSYFPNFSSPLIKIRYRTCPQRFTECDFRDNRHSESVNDVSISTVHIYCRIWVTGAPRICLWRWGVAGGGGEGRP